MVMNVISNEICAELCDSSHKRESKGKEEGRESETEREERERERREREERGLLRYFLIAELFIPSLRFQLSSSVI